MVLRFWDSVAQLVEHSPHTHWVMGSTPAHCKPNKWVIPRVLFSGKILSFFNEKELRDSKKYVFVHFDLQWKFIFSTIVSPLIRWKNHRPTTRVIFSKDFWFFWIKKNSRNLKNACSVTFVQNEMIFWPQCFNIYV